MAESKESVPPAGEAALTPSAATQVAASKGHSPRFWTIIASLSMLSFIAALDTMIITTALPTITREIGGAKQYLWIANSFIFSSSVPQPLIGQFADVLGRKIPMLVCVSLFILGSGIAGGAINPAMLIAGRSVQGVGAGGIYVLIDIITCDLVALRERGKYLAIVNASAGIAAALGPVLGGVLAEHDWRWIFYMNIPICALPLLFITLFMNVHVGAGIYRLRDVDILGTTIFIPSITAILYGLVTGGVIHPWSSWRVILPLVIGCVGWACFHTHQHFIAKRPTVPSRLFTNRTSATGFALSFTSSVVLQAAGYFLPIYFQAVLRTTILKSGIYFLPTAVGTLFSAIIGGVALTKFGVYRPMHAAMFAISTIAFGLFTLLNEKSSTAMWAIFQLILVAGLGLTISVLLPAILAGLPSSDVASATAVFSFIKIFGYVWGVTIPSVIFTATFSDSLSIISSSSLRHLLQDGKAYSFASQMHDVAPTLPPEVLQELLKVYVKSLRSIWWFALALSALSMLMVGLEKELGLSTELETEYGLNENKRVSRSDPVASSEKPSP